MRYRSAQKKRGFTVMESIMAFTILTLSIAAFSGLIVNSLRNFRNSQEKYVAAKIAQEGIELAINKKDNHVQCVEGNFECPITSWQENLVGSHQVESAHPEDLLPDESFPNYNSSSYICVLATPEADRGKYGYCSDEDDGEVLPARYTREVSITSLGSTNAVVKSIVRWNNGRSLTLESLLFAR